MIGCESPTSACVYFPEGYDDAATRENGLCVVESFTWKDFIVLKSS